MLINDKIQIEMKRKITLYLITMLASINLWSQTPANDPHWQNFFSDYFTSINPNVWDVWDNKTHGELDIYMAYNVYRLNNKLNIRVKRENPKVNGYAYSGGWLQTQCAFDYGYFEAKIAFPYGISFHPAFWTFVSFGCPYKEIDIAELFDGKNDSPGGYTWWKNDVNTGYFTCCGPDKADPHVEHNYVNDHTVSHVWGLEWTPNTLIWYVDNIPFRTEPYRSQGTLDQKFHLILNFALDGDYGPDGTTPFPSNMVVDYVKVYTLKQSCSSVINQCSYNFNVPDSYVRSQINIGGQNCTNNVPTGINVILRAAQQISINGQFSIPVGTSFFADIDPCENCLFCKDNPNCGLPDHE
jgi:beta-glucanase (GH16 family)